MNPVSHTSNCGPQPRRRRMLPMISAFLATLLSLPGGAVTYPDVPLQSGKAYPAPNLMFVLDDSDSMEYVSMPADVHGAANLQDTIAHKSYIHNTIYYDPAIEYLGWKQADGSRLSGGAAYGAAYGDPNQLTAPVNLGSGNQTFFVPKNRLTATTTTGISGYYRYQIRSSNGRIVRSETGNQNSSKGEPDVGCGNASDDAKDNANDVYWRNCTYVTPTATRDEAAEKVNYATWYSYHRTRMKVAKAGASEAFSQVGENIRIGFNTIHDINRFDIPVDTDGGLYRGSNKTTWFSRLQAATGSGYTPLRTALQRTGEYYKTDQPWGPAGSDGNTLGCRQNFAILTTDGYWNTNDDDGYVSVGDADGTAGPNGYVLAKPYQDNFKTNPNTRPDTLADVAMYYWKSDLRTALDNNVPRSAADPADWQHMVTFGVSIGLQGNLTPNEATLDAITDGSKRWPDPISNSGAARIDDLWHASVNGRGKFMVASNTKQFTAGVLDAINTVGERTGSASNVTTNSTSFTTDTRVFQAKYVSAKWTGELTAYDATAAGVSADPEWQASSGIPALASRKIFTRNGAAAAAFPTAAQTTALDQTTRITSPVTGASNANYLRGDASLERKNGGELRNRDSLLGDIVNSSPVYVKDTETVYVGANDGMLHAIAAVDSGNGANAIAEGTELFAYVPGGINLGNLATLSDPNYTHKYFVDGPIVASTRAQTPGKNYLVAALGRGGKGVFGLDVTSPGSFGAGDAVWELSTGTNIGQVLGEPLVATLKGGAKVVIFGNGINSSSGHAVLYVVNIATGAVIQEIDTGIGGDNGLSAPRGWDEDGDGLLDYVYAGDLKGNVWKFEFSATGVGSVGYGGQPMFTTQAGQPITAGLALARDPATRKRWVFVGTGRFISESDPNDETVQSMYGLIDDGATTLTLADLTERSLFVVGNLRGFEPATTLDAGSKGWYLDLDEPTPGERVVSRPQVRGSVLVFSSIIPPKDSDSPCAAGGSGYLNAIDVFSGTSTGSPYFDAYTTYLTSPDGDTVPVGSVDPGVGMPTLPTLIDNLLVVGGSTGGLADVKVKPQGGAPRRISWHEIVGN
jgi:type IV pilus assembly protein PilY1